MTKKEIVTKTNVDRVSGFLAGAVESFGDGHAGCSRFKLSDDLAIYVGWSGGYAKDDGDVITTGDGYSLNAAVKVRNDDDWSDYEYLDFPTYMDGGCYDNGGSLRPNMTKKDYESMAKSLLEDFVEIANMHKKGELIYA